MVENVRERWMDALRGIAMLLVVLFHSGTGVAYFGEYLPRSIEVFNAVFEPYRMPLLMFLSGMLLQRSLAKSSKQYYFGKLKRIGWPYLLWSVIGLMLAGDLTLSFLARIFYNPSETHLWYLWFLLIFYTLARLLRTTPSLVLAVISLVLAQFLPEDFRLEKAAFLFAFFMLGNWFASNKDRTSHIFRLPVVWISCASLAVLASVLNVSGVKVLYEPIFALSVVSAIALAIYLTPRIREGRLRNFLEYLGRNSIILYIVHLFAIRVAGTILSALGIVDPWIQYPVFVTVGLGSGLVMMLLVRRFASVNVLFVWPLEVLRRPPSGKVRLD